MSIKNEIKLRKTEKIIGKRKKTVKWDNRLNSFKSMEYEPKTNIGDISSSWKYDKVEGSEVKLKPIGMSGRCLWSKQCKPIKTYTESLYCHKGNDIHEWYFEG